MYFIPQHKAGLYLKEVAGKGMSLFCSNNIKAEEVIESCAALVFNHHEAALIDKTNLYNYYFSLSFLTDNQAAILKIEDKNKAGCLALGMLSLANHSPTPNSKIDKVFLNGRIIFHLRAITAIHAGQEITYSYGKTWFDILPDAQESLNP